MAAISGAHKPVSTALVPAKKKESEKFPMYKHVEKQISIIEQLMMTMAWRMDMSWSEFRATEDYHNFRHFIFPAFGLDKFHSKPRKVQQRKLAAMKYWADGHITDRLEAAKVSSFSALKAKKKALEILCVQGTKAFFADPGNIDLMLERDRAQVTAAKGSLFPEDEAVLQIYWDCVKKNPDLHEQQEQEFEDLRVGIFSKFRNKEYTQLEVLNVFAEAYIEATIKICAGSSATEKVAMLDYIRLRWEITSRAWFCKAKLDYCGEFSELTQYEQFFLDSLEGIRFVAERMNPEYFPEIEMNLAEVSAATFTKGLVHRAEEDIANYLHVSASRRATIIELIDSDDEKSSPD